MAVTIDIGNAADIHPTNKRDVGYRLAANAFKFTYNQPIVYTGPTYSTVQFKQQQAIVSFNNVGSGLLVKDKYGYIKGFEIAGADGVFYYATASINGNTVVVQSAEVTMPVTVRYAWADSPDDVNLFNAEGFPACPFRTDNWKCITAAEKFK
jgi:sialate O-acetylesterase